MNSVLDSEPVDWSAHTRAQKSLYADYFGKHMDKYLAAQEFFQNNPQKKYWNWSAAILGPLWLFYRKIYALLFIWLLIGLPFDFLYFAVPRLDPLLRNPPMSFPVPNYLLLSGSFILVTNIWLGLYGTYYYLRQSEQMVNLTKSKAPVRVASDLLAEKGNPSPWRLLGGVMFIGGIYLLTILLASLWAGRA